MSATKPDVSHATVQALLASFFDHPVTGVQAAEGGQIARAFTFAAGGQDYIVRFNTDRLDANFEKEEFVWRTYASPAVPIPPVVRVGRLGELHYCITRRVAGTRHDRLSPEERDRAVPAVMATLHAIHATDVSRQAGHGLFDGRGHGFSGSWRASLASVRDEERADGFFGRWHGLFESSFLERDVFDRVYMRMEALLAHCPEDRCLVHGGYGFGNLLVSGDRVTAVLDWIDAKYGDFLFDVAWLDYYDPERGYADRFRADYARRGIDVPRFDERVLCYQCYIALDGLRFFASAGNEDGYRWTRARILERISH